MIKPTQEEIDEALVSAGRMAKVPYFETTSLFVKLSATYRAKCEDEDIQRIRAIRAEARAEMLERQYAYLAETVRHGDVAAEDVQAIIQRHAAERDGK